MSADELDPLLAEQVAYYRARAGEYDDTSPIPADDASRERLAHALERFAPRGRVLELACGTGQWTMTLAKHASELTAVDSSPEMLAIASNRVHDDRVRFIEADLFEWQPDGRYDVLFFSAWLSHVPPQRFARFWELVAECLDDDGRVFFIDELPAAEAHEQVIAGGVAPTVKRRLNTGASYRTVKIFYPPDDLKQRLATLGWRMSVRSVGQRFFYATGRRMKNNESR